MLKSISKRIISYRERINTVLSSWRNMSNDNRLFSLHFHLSQRLLQPVQLMKLISQLCKQIEIVKVTRLKIQSKNSRAFHLSLQLRRCLRMSWRQIIIKWLLSKCLINLRSHPFSPDIGDHIDNLVILLAQVLKIHGSEFVVSVDRVDDGVREVLLHVVGY